MSNSLLPKREILSVTELVHRIRDRLEGGFPDVFVEGEIGSFSRPTSGHFYFTLKDKGAQIQAVMFKMQNRYLRFKPENGMEIIARGRVSCYPPRGGLQMILDTMEPKGAGALAAAFEQRKRELAAKDYFDREIKKPIPKLPFCIGIVTSPTAAALQDALRIAFSRHPNLHVLLAPTMVQGDSAPGQIAQALDNLAEDGRAEVILLIRGGGSAEDLWCFNELPVAEAIHRCPIPIVTGIGHEVDFTIADFCADLRAPTPTAAAETAVAKIADRLDEIADYHRRISRSYLHLMERSRDDLNDLMHRLKVRGLPTLVPAQRLDDLSGRLVRAAKQKLENQRRYLDSFSRELFRSGRMAPKNARNALLNLQSRLGASAQEKLRNAAERLELNQGRLGRGVRAELRRNLVALSIYRGRLSANSPARTLAYRREKLSALESRLAHGARSIITEKQQQLRRNKGMLQALSPMNVLERGYSITRKIADGRILRNAGQTAAGESLEVLLAKGRLKVVVEDSSEK